MLFLDTETCGFEGPIILLQYAVDDGPVQLHNVWTSKVSDTLRLIEMIVDSDICGFNLAFDWFKICQCYTTLLLLDPNRKPDILEYALAEPEARFGPCLKPKSAIDLMLIARQGKYQSTMARKPIIIKRVPSKIAFMMAYFLEEHIQFPDIYFAKRKVTGTRWQVEDIDGVEGFKNVTIRFKPSTGLKDLCIDAGIMSSAAKFEEANERILKYKPVEYKFAPYAMAHATKTEDGYNWNGTWPDVIEHHIEHWTYDSSARAYATADIDPCTRDLYKFFGSPTFDMNSELACQVASTRWRGFKINIEKMQALKKKYESSLKGVPTAANPTKKYLMEVLEPEEYICLENDDGAISTSKAVLEALEDFKYEIYVDDEVQLVEHPVVQRAKDVLRERQLKYRIKLLEYLIRAGRFHVSVNVIGAKSSRASGGLDEEDKAFNSKGSVNPQGIPAIEEIRECFDLADEGYKLSGGDFDSFEVGLADAYYQDPNIYKDLTAIRPDGKVTKIHAVVGAMAFKQSYDAILATKDTENDLYKKGKSALFALIYFGNEFTLRIRLGVDEETGIEVMQRILSRYSVMAEKREEFSVRFVAAYQPNGIGSKVLWREPEDYVESMLGFRRYFTLENQTAKALYDLAQNIPKTWKQFKFKVQRRREEHGGQQTAYGAAQSALYAAVFAILEANKRAAGNHVIQSTGATITKRLQYKIYGLQPQGIHPWVVQEMNVHDELDVVHIPEVEDDLIRIVKEHEEEYRKIVRLIGITFKTGMSSWAGK